MFLKTNHILIIIISSFLFYSPVSSYFSIHNTHSRKLLAEIPMQNIHLYALDWEEEDINQSGVYKKILLDINGKQKYFSWTLDKSEAFKPQLILSDLNNDKINELIVIFTSDRGTGIDVQKVHVFDTITFSEITVADPLEIISSKVKTELNHDDAITIRIAVDNNIFKTTASKSSAIIWLDNIYFGNKITYTVVDKKLIALVGAQVSTSLFVGDIKIDYFFKNDTLTLNKIYFKKFLNTDIFK